MTKSKESVPTQGKRARLTRRKFLGSGAIVGAALVVSSALLLVRASAGLTTNAAPTIAPLPKNFRRVKRARLPCVGTDSLLFVIAFFAPQKFSLEDSIHARVYSSCDVPARYNAEA